MANSKASLSAWCNLIFSILPNKFSGYLENYFKNSLRQCFQVKLQIQILRAKQGLVVKISLITSLNS